ncbi:hypothetical protein IFM89_017811 [Coptis chinensis]|uniref:Transposase n=1 Tax=Coptis chinensis TaxID=261450 RepID=A0A835H419_9MAGN|nr:hypothetical protein IFM89_017811 [Coptis chinensis]
MLSSGTNQTGRRLVVLAAWLISLKRIDIANLCPRFQVEFTDDGLATGQYRAKYATIVRQVARTHCPPMYKDWAEVPELTKDALWKNVLEEIDLPLIRKECTLRKLNTAWKQKKYELRQVYDKFPTDAKRKRNVPVKVKKEEWEAFVDMCSIEEDKTKQFNGKLAREQMKNPHTTGRMGAVPVIEQLKKNSPTGEVSKTEGYVTIHTRRDESCINFETKQSLEEINRLVSNEPDIVERDLDNDPVAMGTCSWSRAGSGVTKTVYHASAPYKEIAQREKRARENSELGYEAIMARLDEADKARKILEDEVADLKRQSSGLENASQVDNLNFELCHVADSGGWVGLVLVLLLVLGGVERSLVYGQRIPCLFGGCNCLRCQWRISSRSAPVQVEADRESEREGESSKAGSDLRNGNVK